MEGRKKFCGTLDDKWHDLSMQCKTTGSSERNVKTARWAQIQKLQVATSAATWMNCTQGNQGRKEEIHNSQCKWLTEVWTKLLAGSLGLVRKGRSVVGCARPRTRWVTGAQSPSPSSKLELRPSSGPKEGKCAELKILLNGFYPPLIEESLSMGCNVRGKSCLWILIALHGTSSQDAIIHIAMPGPGISQQVFVFKPLGSVLQTSTQEKASESCIGAFL